MARANLIQTNFTSGEVSPLMRGRVDTTRYANGAERVENFLIKPQGGAWRRSGTRYINTVKFPDKRTRVVKFEFSTVQAYVLEFGETYVRFYKDGGVIVDSDGDPVEVITSYLAADLAALYFAQSADVIYVCHPNYPTIKIERHSHVDWRVVPFETTDGPYLSTTPPAFLRLTNVTDVSNLSSDTAATFAIGDIGKFVEYRENNVYRLCKILSFVDGKHVTVDVIDQILVGLDPNNKFTSQIAAVRVPDTDPQYGGGAPNLLAATILSGVPVYSNVTVGRIRFVVPDAKLTQAAGTISTTYSGVFSTADIGKYVRINDGSWWKITAFTDSSNVSGTSAAQLAIAPTTFLSLSNRQVNSNVKASQEVFDVTDIGRKIRVELSGQQSWGTITSFVDTKEVVVNFRQDLPLDPGDNTRLASDGITDIWRLGAWSSRSGYPSCVVFHEQRTVFASTSQEPQSVWMSRSGDYQNFSPTEPDSTVLDDSAITYTIASSEANRVVWLQSGPVLLIGTIGSTYQCKAASSVNEPITPTNISVTPTQSAYGSSSSIRPVRVGSAVLFVQRSGRKVRELIYDYAIDGFVAKNLNIIAEHMLRRGGNKNRAVDAAYQQEPNNILWMALQNGELVAMTYEKDQEVVAWHYHPLGGTNVRVESVAVVPSVDGTEDSLYMVVCRRVNGDDTRYIEMLEKEHEPTSPEDKSTMFFLDCGLTYSGSPTTVITGLQHLANETVGLLADGSVLPDQTVSSTGTLVLSSPASVVQAGYRFTSVLKTLPLEGGSQAGTSQGKIKRVTKVDIRLLNSIGFQHGSSLDALTTESFRTSDGPMDESPLLATEDVRVSLDQGYTQDGGYFIVQDSPYPLTVLALMPQLDTYE